MYDKYKKLGEFFGVSFETVRKWPKQRLQRAQIEYEVGAEPGIANLLAEIQRLAWIYNCANVRGTEQLKSCTVQVPSHECCSVMFHTIGSYNSIRNIHVNLNAHNAVAQLKNAKSLLEQHIYGAEKNAR